MKIVLDIRVPADEAWLVDPKTLKTLGRIVNIGSTKEGDTDGSTDKRTARKKRTAPKSLDG